MSNNSLQSIYSNNNMPNIATAIDSAYAYPTSRFYAKSGKDYVKENCENLYKLLMWNIIKKYKKDMFTESEHTSMFNMLNSDDIDSLKLLEQILISKSFEFNE